MEGQSHIFECQVRGNPRPTVTWFKETSFIKSSEALEIVSDEDTYKLIIKQVILEDTGMYTVVAKNNSGFATCSAEIFVEGKY